jgi:ATP-dependent Lhr-like helicase
MAFEGLDQKIQDWLKKVNYLEGSLPQKLAIPRILGHRNVLIMAPTGMGKTLAAILPLFNKILRDKERPGIRLLYVSPLKSLNRDLFDRILDLANFLNIDVDLRHGDTPPKIRAQQVADPAKVLIVTPETLQSILIGKRFREHLKNVEWIVIDEVHEIVNNKRGTQLTLALERLKELRLGQDFQRIGLSATIGDPEKVAKFISSNSECDIVDARAEKSYEIEVEYPRVSFPDFELAKKLSVGVAGAYCLRRIKELVEANRSTIIFVNTRETAESLGAKFRNWLPDFPIAVHHSSLSKDVRIDVEKKFKDGELKAIISTSSLELGIDVGTIDLVIQYGSPRQVTKIVQRVGRSGHGIGRTSKGIILCSSIDDYLESLAIVERSKERWLEEPIIPEKAYDVLAHQIVGLCIDLEKPSKQRIFDVVKRTYPFRELSKEEFNALITLMSDIRLIGFEHSMSERLYRTRRGLLFYFDGLSTIPNEKNFNVINKELNRRIGVLHQGFVSQYIKNGVEFIMKGEPWKVVELEEDNINVISSRNGEGAVPSWEGELIPVPREVASLASDMRKSFDFDDLLKQKKEFVVPTSKTMYIETFENFIIIHSCFGSKINETLAKMLAALISTKIGTTVAARSDAYRLILRIPDDYGQELVVQALNETEPEWIRSVLERSLRNSSLFEFRFYNVARRFGIISKDAEYSGSMLQKLIDTYVGTPVYEETMHELLREKLDIEGATQVVREVKKGTIEIVSSAGYDVSPLGASALDYNSVSFMKPKERIKEILDLIRHRLLNKKFWMACMNCGTEFGTYANKDMPGKVACRNCDAKLIGFISSKEAATARKVLQKYFNSTSRGAYTRISSQGDRGSRDADLNPEERMLIKKFSETAELFLNYGPKVCYVMAGYGIGPTTAKRILAKFQRTEDELLMDIVNAERSFISTRQFWATS